ncbi:hypothetical protein [Capnocytophaga ochracea]|uniref:hypothetical protein n=1 Tax=Capnocytophaga ochracea TaxID=1018 RepID=UPI001364A8DF|nr:hypothetical protein [Capnocytophaga ochracea]
MMPIMLKMSIVPEILIMPEMSEIPKILIINFAKGRSTTGGVSHAGSVSRTGC